VGFWVGWKYRKRTRAEPGGPVTYVTLTRKDVTSFRVNTPSFMSETTFRAENKSKLMSNLLYIVAVILVILWAIGYLGFQAGGIIHILLVIAIIAVLFKVISGRRL
jgi:predicted ferric reductase